MRERSFWVEAAMTGLISGCAAREGALKNESDPVDIAAKPVVSADASTADRERSATTSDVSVRRVLGSEADGKEANCCKGKNECKGLGGCKNERNGCRGMNDCKGRGGCKVRCEASAKSGNCCKGFNECKGKGMCKTNANACKGLNSCKGQGGCKPPSC
jgi:hypothetical protein